MPDFDAGFKIVAHHAGKQLARVAGVMSETWEPLTGELHATERLADRAFLAGRNDKPFVVYMEAYTRWKKEAPWSMLEKSGRLSARERLPTLTLAYVLLPRGYRSQGGSFRLEVDSQPTQQI